ncbi:MAG: hypothetical protein IIW36_00560 [Clostridia bacterium]|nr:hypothetical protein [Clostridia bacterium]
MTETICFFVLAALLAVAFLLFPRQKRTKCFALCVLAGALLFEIFVANFHSFHLLFAGTERTEISLESEDVLLSGGVDGGLTSKTNGGTLTVELSDLSKKVGTVAISCDFLEGCDWINVKVDAKDDTQPARYRSGVADGQILRTDERSAVILLDLSGNVHALRLQLSTEKEASFTVTGVTLNQAVPFRFSILRLALILIAFLSVYALLTFPSMRASYEKRPHLFERIAFALTAVGMLAAVVLTVLYQYDRTGGVISDFLSQSGNQITKELVDAFSAGQVSLLEKPSEELLALENPYDWSQRSAAGVSYLWDHLLFEGKYYSYYGVAPVLLLFLPYHLVTGAYFPTPEAVLLFGGLGILFLTLLFLEFAKRFCRRIPLNVLIASLVILQCSSGVWYNFCSPLFYEIAQTAGFLFTCLGFFLLLRSGVIGEGSIRLASLCGATLCLSLAVLSRPTLALYCVASLPFLAYGFFKYTAECHGWKARIRGAIPYLCAALLPYVILGGGQMLYNYARFGSFLDFGIQYSLTINDFTRSQYHTDFVAIGFYNFLLAFPQIKPDFPYVFSNYSSLSTNGYYFLATNNAGGLLWRALPTFGYFGIVGAWRALTRKERRAALWLLLPTCVLAPFVILFSIWESGYAVRYCTDFAWQTVLGGMAILFLLSVRRAEKQTQRILQNAFVAAALLSVIVNAGLLYGFMSREGYLQSQYLELERIFDFWK